MSRSVKITTPMPSLDEIASDLGIAGNRLDGLLELVNGTKKNGGRNGSVSLVAPRVKKAAKNASARRVAGKHGRSAR
jgi:hypothetical protein